MLAHNLNDIRNWASLIGLLLRICWCLLSVFLIYCSDEWKKLVNLIYCFQVLFRMNFKIMYFLMKILGNTPSADSAASRDSLSSQNATWGIVFFSSFYWWHIEYKGWMCERLLNLQEIYVSGQNICIVVYGNSVGTIIPLVELWPFIFPRWRPRWLGLQSELPRPIKITELAEEFRMTPQQRWLPAWVTATPHPSLPREELRAIQIQILFKVRKVLQHVTLGRDM